MTKKVIQTTSKNLFAAGKGYFQTAKIVARSPDNNPSYAMTIFWPMHMLMGFSAELYLKSLLLHYGKTEAELKKIGHNLKELYREAVELGLPEDGRARELVDHLHLDHLENSYRYIPVDREYAATDYNVAFQALYALDVKIDTILGLSAEFGLAPGH